MIPIMMLSMKKVRLRIFLFMGFALWLWAGQPEKPPLIICCAGDSLMRPMPAYFRQLLPSLAPKFILQEWAQGGLNSVTYQGFFRQQAGRWRRVTPDIILLQLGTNDVVPVLEGRITIEDFKINMTAIIREFQAYRNASGQNPYILVATIPFFSDDPTNQNKNRLVKEAVNPGIREVVEKTGVRLVDNFSILAGKPELYDPDGVHPNPGGEAALAANWIQAVKICLRIGIDREVP
jgi:lysophospholipase L1-like esterase